jgi:hypothetical protein
VLELDNFALDNIFLLKVEKFFCNFFFKAFFGSYAFNYPLMIEINTSVKFLNLLTSDSNNIRENTGVVEDNLTSSPLDTGKPRNYLQLGSEILIGTIKWTCLALKKYRESKSESRKVLADF